jgi:hypothetical protein
MCVLDGTYTCSFIRPGHESSPGSVQFIRRWGAMCAVVVSQTSCNDRNHPILRGVIAPHQDFFFFFAKITILLDF